MASPDMFLSSPSSPRRAFGSSPLTISSSPGLPPLKDVVSQRPSTPVFQRVTSNPSRIENAPPGPTAAADARHSNASIAHYVRALDSAEPSSDPFETMKTPPRKKQPWKQFKPRSPTQLGLQPAAGKPSEGVDQPASRGTNSPLNLEQAPVRRLDWTPPTRKDSTGLGAEAFSQADHLPSQSQDDAVQPFNKLLEAYKFAETEGSKEAATASEEESSVFRKRKLIECVAVKASSEGPVEPEKAPAKRKAAKKKPRTITAMATAAYKPATQPDPASQPADDTRPKPSTMTEQSAPKSAKGNPNAKPRRRTARAPKKKAAPAKPVLLSPSAALRQVANQDFVFGTSSQLAGDHSPTFLRDLATALRRSNEIDMAVHSSPLNSDTIEPPEQRQFLWDAAARDEDGDLFHVGVRELAEGAAELPEWVAQTDPFGYVKEVNEKKEDSFLNLSDILEQPDEELRDLEPPRASNTHELVCLDSSPVSTLPEVKQPVAAPPESAGPVSGRAAKDDTVAIPAAPRPNFELFTDAQLSKEVASYGFKDIKSRNAQIGLLDRCWHSKMQQVGGSLSTQRQASTLATAATSRSKGTAAAAPSPTKTPARTQCSVASSLEPQEPPPSAQPVESPKRKRGRPRKTAVDTPVPATKKPPRKTATAKSAAPAAPTTPKRRGKGRTSKVVVEIPDSESEAAAELSDLSQSPPCSTQDEIFSPARAVDMSVSMDEDTEISISVSPSDQPESFGYIKKAITTAPRTTDPQQPSWHEKMLMYDPIVVEDLAAWLNSGELTRVGFDDEVSSGEVKKWCESKSICCLWKVNLRGKERKRF